MDLDSSFGLYKFPGSSLISMSSRCSVFPSSSITYICVGLLLGIRAMRLYNSRSSFVLGFFFSNDSWSLEILAVSELYPSGVCLDRRYRITDGLEWKTLFSRSLLFGSGVRLLKEFNDLLREGRSFFLPLSSSFKGLRRRRVPELLLLSTLWGLTID